jgi:hypothetical protein
MRRGLYDEVVLKPIPVPPPVTGESVKKFLNQEFSSFHSPTTTQFLTVSKEAAVREGAIL